MPSSARGGVSSTNGVGNGERGRRNTFDDWGKPLSKPQSIATPGGDPPNASRCLNQKHNTMKRSRRVRIGKAAWWESFLAAVESTAEAWARPVHSSGNTNDVRSVEAALGELSPVASDGRRGRSSTRKYRLAPIQPNLSRVMLRIDRARDQSPRKKLLRPLRREFPVSALFIVRPVRTAKSTSVY